MKKRSPLKSLSLPILKKNSHKSKKKNSHRENVPDKEINTDPMSQSMTSIESVPEHLKSHPIVPPKDVSLTKIRSPKDVSLTKIRSPKDVSLAEIRSPKDVSLTKIRSPKDVSLTKIRSPRDIFSSPFNEEQLLNLINILNNIFGRLPLINEILFNGGYVWGEFLSWLVTRIIHLGFKAPDFNSIVNFASQVPIKCWLYLNDFNHQPLTSLSRKIISENGTIKWIPSYDLIFLEKNLETYSPQFPLELQIQGSLLLPAGSYWATVPVNYDSSLGKAKPLPRLPDGSNVKLSDSPKENRVRSPREVGYKISETSNILYHIVHSMDLSSSSEYSVDGLVYSKNGLRSRFQYISLNEICSDSLEKRLIPHPLPITLNINEAVRRLRDPTIVKFSDLYALIKTIKRGTQLYQRGYRCRSIDNQQVFQGLGKIYQETNNRLKEHPLLVSECPTLIEIIDLNLPSKPVIEKVDYNIQAITSLDDEDLIKDLEKLSLYT